MNETALRKRYRWLWTGEAAAIAIFIALLVLYARPWQAWLACIYSVGVVIAILLQAVGWWRAKLKLLAAQQRRMPAQLLRIYRRLKWVNWLLIGAFPLVAASTAALRAQPFWSSDTAIGLLILVGALLEQVNYYYYQLMYDSQYDLNHLRTQRSLRRGSIAKALDAALP